MSSLLQAEACEVLAPDWLSRLREEDNPFDDFVQSRQPQRSFRRRHVEAVNRGVLDKLLATLERYRLDSRRADQQSLTHDDVPRSGVLLVLGPRGAGKTHLVHALRSGTRETPACPTRSGIRENSAVSDRPSVAPGGILTNSATALVIAPPHYEPHRPFAEYLLQLLVAALQDESPASGPATLGRLADWFARQAAVQALYGMTDTQWLARQAGRGGFWRGLLGLNSRAVADRRELLINSLLNPELRTVHEVCRYREYEPLDLRTIALVQVATTQQGRTIGGQIRRGLYLALARLAFDGNVDEVLDFLCDGFTRVEAQTAPSRETLVEELLAALTELFLLFGEPVAFAFDALETLLGDPPDERRSHAFFRGLAEVLDSHRGIPCFLFAEAGHWEQAQRYLSSYAQQRLQQGVPTRGHGSLRQLNLPPVTADDLAQLVEARLSALLEHHGQSPPDELRLGPFRREDLAAIARSGTEIPPLRQMLQALRDLYQQRVFHEGPATDAGGGATGPTAFDRKTVLLLPADTVAIPDLMDVWQRQYKAVLRRIEAEGFSAQGGPLLLGLQKWLEYLAREGTQTGGWHLSQAEIVAFGNNPTYGQLTRCRWQNGDRERHVGIAFLLGQKSAMPRDLKEKLKMMVSHRPVVESLVVLWPHELELPGAAEKQLPTATRKVWEETVTGPLSSRLTLRAIEPRSLAAWLTIDPWEASLREEGPLPQEAVQHFLAEETAELFDLVAPQEEPQDECLAAR
jgi:hypothetical protein